MPFLFYWGPLSNPIQYREYCRAVQGLNRSTNGLKQWCSFDPNLFISRNSKDDPVPQKDTLVPVRVEKTRALCRAVFKDPAISNTSMEHSATKKSCLTWLILRAFKSCHVLFLLCFLMGIFFLVPTGVGCIAWRCSP